MRRRRGRHRRVWRRLGRPARCPVVWRCRPGPSDQQQRPEGASSCPRPVRRPRRRTPPTGHGWGGGCCAPAGSPPGPRLRRLLVSLLLSWLVLSVTIWVMPGVTASARWDVLLAAAVLGVVAALLGPLVTSFALLLGWAGVLVAAVFAEALFFYAALALTPDIQVGGFWDVFWSSWVYSLLMAVVTWLVSTGDDAAFLSYLLRQSRGSRRTRRARPTPTALGTLVVLARGGLRPGGRAAGAAAAVGPASGDLPTLTRWVRSGSHTATTWDVAAAVDHPGQPGGAAARRQRQVPAFRWYEKDSGGCWWPTTPGRRRDPAAAQRRPRACWPTGASASPTSSPATPRPPADDERPAPPPPDAGPSRGYAAFFINPYGLTRSLVLSVGEMVKELLPGAAAARPRRGAADQPARLLRRCCAAVTNVLLRDLNAGLDRRADDGRRTRRSTATSPTTTRSPTTPARPGRSRWPRWPGSTTSSGSLQVRAEQAPRAL